MQPPRPDSDEPAPPPNTPASTPSDACPPAPPARLSRYELLLLPGASGLRGALQEVAAIIGYPIDPESTTDPGTPQGP